jgi:hypothetical protein
MWQLITDFLGVCTHFKRSPQVPYLPTPHRVVMVNAMVLSPGFGRLGIQPHFASVWIVPAGGPPRKIEGPVTGAPVYSLGGPIPEVSYAPAYNECLPRLDRYCGYTPSADVVLNGDAACYFDATGGELSLIPRGRERAVRLTSSIPDGQTCTLVRTTQGGKSVIFELNQGDGVLFEMVTGMPGLHSDNDFLLHYLTAEGGPPTSLNFSLPGQGGALNMPLCGGMLGRPGAGVGELETPACSNSGYP